MTPHARRAGGGLSGLGRMVRRCWPLLRRERLVVGGAFMALLAEVGLRLLEPWPLKFVFDWIIPLDSSPPTSLPVVGRVEPGTLLGLAAFSVLCLIGLRAGAAYFSVVGFALAGTRVLTEIRAGLYRHLQSLSLSFHHGARQGDLTLRVIGDVGLLKDIVVTAFMPLVANVLVLAGMLAMMFLMEWRLALLATAVLPGFWLFTGRIGRRIGEASRVQRQREGALAATAAESVAAIAVVKALSLESMFTRSFTSHNRRSLADGVRVKRLSAGLERTVDLMIGTATALVLWAGARLVIERVLTPGDLVVFLAYLKNAFKPLQDLAKYSGRLAKGSAAADRVLDLLERTPEVRDSPGAVTAGAFKGHVRFDAVSFDYGRDGAGVHEVHLSCAPGQRIVLTGPSGSGKSTLLSLLLRLYDPASGRVLVDGRDVREFTIESLRRQLAVVLQDTVLFAGTIRDNIACGQPDVSAADIEAAARLANADGFIRELPGGYDAVVGERGVTLSSGQRQRIAIARAAVRRAPILLLDEPTTGLDEPSARAVTEALRRLANGPTTILATHDPRLVAEADVVVCLERGRVVEVGPPDELLAAGGAYARLHQLFAARSCRETGLAVGS